MHVSKKYIKNITAVHKILYEKGYVYRRHLHAAWLGSDHQALPYVSFSTARLTATCQNVLPRDSRGDSSLGGTTPKQMAQHAVPRVLAAAQHLLKLSCHRQFPVIHMCLL